MSVTAHPVEPTKPLGPCPFAGSHTNDMAVAAGYLLVDGEEVDNPYGLPTMATRTYYVECGCGARGPFSRSLDEAIDQWNVAPDELAWVGRYPCGCVCSVCQNTDPYGLTDFLQEEIAAGRDLKQEPLGKVLAEWSGKGCEECFYDAEAVSS